MSPPEKGKPAGGTAGGETQNEQTVAQLADAGRFDVELARQAIVAAQVVKRWLAAEPQNAPSLREAIAWCVEYSDVEIAAAFALVKDADRLATYRTEFGSLLKLRRQAEAA